MASAESTTPEEPSIDRRSAHVGIVCTQQSEIDPLLSYVDRQRKYVDNGVTFRGGFIDETTRLALVEAGAGFAQHRQATQTLIAEHNPAWVIAVGFSSPLSDELQHGDLSVANEICDTHGNNMALKCGLTESKRVLVRKHVVADSHPLTVAERKSLAEETTAAVVDTTSLAVAQACRNESEPEKSTRFLSIRGIVATADRDLPEKAVQHLFQPETDAGGNLLSKLTGRLRKDPELTEWNQLADETAKNLNRYLLSIVRQLAQKLGV